ncbi:hypothetical protein HGM15179_019051 [Zosterops borbonicus]|uniref:Uncharacterized protein n=1 Tax=Zosterops borbonicus TaxID=364589 RepID=A0A8K1D9F7_9PASS|nr:hypothetical protein HGM15179_019051 [Zosterops borbonicus]
MQDKVIEAKALPADVSSQKAKPIALMRALDLSKGKKVNIWTDSKYAFSVVHTHRAIRKERGLLNAQVSKCEICCKNNPDQRKRVVLGVKKTENLLGDYWQIDFAELPHKEGYRYILVLVDPFSGWPEAYPCRTNTAKEVAKVLLNDIIPGFRVPLGMSSDRGPYFVAMVVKEVRRIWGITWDLHTPYRPQVSGKFEHMNGTLKTQISKICQEASMTWVQALPIALLRICIQPRQRDNISPYEILYGRPYQIRHIPGVVDTGSDITIVAHSKWPQGWEVVLVNGVISGIGGAATSMWSKRSIVIEGPDGQIGTIRLFVVKAPINLWDGVRTQKV